MNEDPVTDDLWSIDLADAGASSLWATRLGVSEDELCKAVAAVGSSATAVRDHLDRSASLHRSDSGAVLGQPDQEYGAYGMVKEPTGGETPSREERAIRGLGKDVLPVDKQ